MEAAALPTQGVVFQVFRGRRGRGGAAQPQEVPIAAYRLNLNAPSSAGARVQLTALQSGIG
jgi:hypothetical protein